MTEVEVEEVALIITQALMSYRATRDGDRLARGRHIVTALEDHDWILMKETPK